MLGPIDVWMWTTGVAIATVRGRVTDRSGPLVLLVDDSGLQAPLTDRSGALVRATLAPEDPS